MTNFASFHNNTRRFLSSSPRHFSIAQTIVNITIFILAQKSTTTDEYWWSFGPAKFDAAMAEFEAKTRRAEAPSILVCFLHIMHINVANSIFYHRVTSRHCYNNIISFITANNTEMDCTTEQISFVLGCGVVHALCGGSFQRDLSYPIRGRRMKILLLLGHFDATKGPRGVIPSWL
jgi:hypothetical protein